MATPTVSIPAIDYTDKDFESLRQAMLDLATYRLPEWTDRSQADIGMLLVDLFALVGDTLSYYQDRIASESFLDTAVERRSVMHLLRLIGYDLAPAAAATAEIDLVFNAPADPATAVVVEPGAAFAVKPTPGATAPPPTFSYLGPRQEITLAGLPARADGRVTYSGLPVRHCVLVRDELLGRSTGEPNQRFELRATTLLADTLTVRVDEGAGSNDPWTRQDNLLFHRDDSGLVKTSDAQSRDYMVQFDENGIASVVFGDGVFGKKPAAGATITATYPAGGGAAGNVAAGAISQAVTQIPQLYSVTNKLPAAGGADAETVDHARRFGPLAFRSGDRAVTLRDYAALALRAGGVAKVQARSTGWNRVELVVAPEGPTLQMPSDQLKQDLVKYFEDRRMVGTSVRIQNPTPVRIDIAVELLVEHHHDQTSVNTRAEAAVRDLVAFANVDFGRPLYLSKVYEAVEAIDGVAAATVLRFRRQDQRVPPAFLRKRGVLVAAGLADVGNFVERAFTGEIAVEGRIEIGAYELPEPGDIRITMRYEP